MYHAAWEVGELGDLARADPDGLEFELFWTVPGGTSVRTRPLDLEAELTRRGLPVP